MHDIFGRGGAQRAAHELAVPYLGDLPMFTELRINSDSGNPTANFTSNPNLKTALEKITQNLAGEVSKRNLGTPGPTLTVT